MPAGNHMTEEDPYRPVLASRGNGIVGRPLGPSGARPKIPEYATIRNPRGVCCRLACGRSTWGSAPGRMVAAGDEVVVAADPGEEADPSRGSDDRRPAMGRNPGWGDGRCLPSDHGGEVDTAPRSQRVPACPDRRFLKGVWF